MNPLIEMTIWPLGTDEGRSVSVSRNQYGEFTLYVEDLDRRSTLLRLTRDEVRSVGEAINRLLDL